MKIMIVDDEVYTIQSILTSVDWKQLDFQDILTANSYTQALNLLLQDNIDLLLCDIEMPYGTGLELVQWVKDHQPDTECIILTCHSEFSYAQKAVQLQCLDYVLKPAPPERLMEVLNKAQECIQEKRKNEQYQIYGKRYIREFEDIEETTRKDKPEAVEQVKKYIQDHISENFSVETLARLVFLSPDYLSRLFKKMCGQTLIDYIIEQRLLLAVRLLEETDMSVSMISSKVGYGNYSYFTRVFKKKYGVSPREYRGRCRNDL